MQTQKTWFVTGASRGLGLTLVKQLLSSGFNVAATSRTKEALEKELGEESESFLPLETDLTNETSVNDAVLSSIKKFGKLNIIVNNAGFGQIGTLEELSDEEVRKSFDVNVFGVLNVIRATMPHLRAQGSGHIIDISSIGGYFAGFAGWGIYCATKFAVAGLTESLAYEVKEFGVHATTVYPGYFRTDFLSSGSLGTPAKPIKAYEAARASQIQHESSLNGNQQGDPEKAVTAIIQMAASPNPPVHFILGSDAYALVQTKNELVKKDMDSWKELATSTDFKEI